MTASEQFGTSAPDFKPTVKSGEIATMLGGFGFALAFAHVLMLDIIRRHFAGTSDYDPVGILAMSGILAATDVFFAYFCGKVVKRVRVVMNEQGIGSDNFLGPTIFIPWTDVKAVMPFSPGYKLYGEDGGTVIIFPKMYRDSARMDQYIVDRLPPAIELPSILQTYRKK